MCDILLSFLYACFLSSAAKGFMPRLVQMTVPPPWVLALSLLLTAPPLSLRKREPVQPSGPLLGKWEQGLSELGLP